MYGIGIHMISGSPALVTTTHHHSSPLVIRQVAFVVKELIFSRYKAATCSDGGFPWMDLLGVALNHGMVKKSQWENSTKMDDNFMGILLNFNPHMAIPRAFWHWG